MSGADNIKWADLPAQYEDACVGTVVPPEKVLESGGYIGGPLVTEFEEQWAKYCDVDHAIGMSSGTDALTACVWAVHEEACAYDYRPKILVITQANTFIATVNAALRVPGVFVECLDCDEYYQLSLSDLRRSLAVARARNYWDKVIVLPVHMYGDLGNMAGLLQITEQEGDWVVVIEDASHAHGTMYHDGRRAGKFGHMAAFSCFPTKPLGACGDAGIVATSRSDYADAIRGFSNVGREQANPDLFPREGYTHRMDAIQAVVLRAKLRKLDSWRYYRNSVAVRYRQGLQCLSGVGLPYLTASTRECAWYAFPIRVAPEHRASLRNYLLEQGVPTRIYYPVPIPNIPIMRAHPRVVLPSKMANAERFAKEIICLPIHESITPEQTTYVAECVYSGCKKLGIAG